MASEQRLHPLSFVFTIGSQFVFLGPALFVLIVSRRAPWELGLAWASIPAAIYAVVRHLAFRYAFEEDELVVRTGFLFRNERHIRYARIHNIDTVRNPLHRLLGVAEVRIETAGGSEPEAKLRVLSVEAVDEMRRRVFEGKRAAAGVHVAPAHAPGPATQTEAAPEENPPAEVRTAPERELVRLRLRDLVVFGLVENRGFLVILAAVGLLWEFNVLGSGRASPEKAFRAAWEFVSGAGLSLWKWDAARVLELVGLIVALLFVIRVLSVAWAIVQLHGFRLTRSGDELRSTYGLLTERRGITPVSRIQLVTVSEAPIHRLFGCVVVRVQTAGGAEESNEGRSWLAPVLPRADVPALLGEVLPGFTATEMEWHAVHPRARTRLLREWLWVALGATVLAVLAARFWGLLVLPPLVALGWFASRGQARGYAYALGPDVSAFRSGWLWKQASYARFAKFQAATLAHSPFDRRWSMATVAGDTPGGGTHRITIPYLPAEEARRVFEHFGGRIAETEFRW